MSDTQKYSIKCTNCAAPLSLIGGGRVSTVTCSYCNSILDLNDNYKVVAKFNAKERPDVPFTLGMKGTIKGVEWTIIGMITYRTDDPEEWTEFFLYSPLYGYGWLVYEKGRLSFSKRVRDFELREWREKNYPRTLFYRKGHYLAAEESYYCYVGFVEGEMSWVAKANDRIECWDYNGVQGRSLSIERSNSEYEVYLNEKLDNESVYKSFGVDKSKQVSPTKSIREKLIDEDAIQSPASPLLKGLGVILAVLLLSLIGSYYTDKTVFYKSTDHPFTQEMNITSDAYVTQIALRAPSAAILNNYTLSLHQNGKRVFHIDKALAVSESYYFKKTWKQGSNLVNVYIKLPQGNYSVSLAKANMTGTSGIVTVTVKEKYARLNYILPLFLLTLATLFYLFFMGSPGGGSWKKYTVWSIGGLGAVYWLGVGAVVFVIVLYIFIQPMIDNFTSYKEEDE